MILYMVPPLVPVFQMNVVKHLQLYNKASR